jgi:UDP-N-acetylglucosamine--dolichyl-phosphate N-acetylglucosaminephosphotransferase
MISDLYFALALVFLYSAFSTFATGEYLCRKFKLKGFVVRDLYKKGKPNISNLGGVAGFVGLLTAAILFTMIIKEFDKANILIFFFIVLVHALFGLIDDLIFISNHIKIFAPFFMAFPIILLVKDAHVALFTWDLSLGALYLYLIAPVYLMVVTNLINMHSGFNGLASGLTLILASALTIRTFMKGPVENLFFILPVLGALFSLHYFDKYPAKMIWGNVGSMMIGSAIGAYILVSKAELFGIIILMPHIIDFLLYLVSVVVKRKNFDKIKFGKLRKDGTIIAPTRLKLKFLLPYYFRLNEKQTTQILHLITAVFCVVGLVSGL